MRKSRNRRAQVADPTRITRGLLVKRCARLHASALPLTEPARLDLQAELIGIMVATAPPSE